MELIKIETKQPLINLNFEEAKRQLQADLERYQGVVVTPESVDDDKKLATELNKRAGEIKRLRIDTEKELTAPVRQFGDQMKELESLCLTVREEIHQQVKKYEQARLDKAQQQLESLRSELRENHEITPEHYMAEFDDLIKLGSLTASDKLTKGAKDELTRRVMDEMHAQQKTHTRLVELENACHRAGLSAPLTKENVEAFLYDDDESYQHRLSSLIESEKRREQQAREKFQAEQSQQKSEPETQAQPQQQESLITPEQRQRAQAVSQGAAQQEKPAPGVAVITATFKVPVPAHIPSDFVLQKLRGLLESAGITSLESLDIERS